MIFNVALVGVIAEIMVFFNEEKAVIKNDFLEKGWNAYKICKEHPTKSWNRVSVYRLLKIFQEDNSMDRRAGSGRQQTITTEENENLIENLICSQEDNPGSHMSPGEIEKNTGLSRTSREVEKNTGISRTSREVEKNTSISRTSIRRMIKRR